jgi:hypothetical protein
MTPSRSVVFENPVRTATGTFGENPKEVLVRRSILASGLWPDKKRITIWTQMTESEKLRVVFKLAERNSRRWKSYARLENRRSDE